MASPWCSSADCSSTETRSATLCRFSPRSSVASVQTYRLAHEIPMSGSARLTVPLIADMVVALLDGLGIGRATFVGNDAGR